MPTLRNQPDVSPSASGMHRAKQTALPCGPLCLCVILPAPPTNEQCFKTWVSVAQVTSRPEQILGVPEPSPDSGLGVYRGWGENQQMNLSASREGE